MLLHLSTDGAVTKCGRPVGELVLDGCTGDPDLFDCPECEDNLGRPYAAAAAAESYHRGYDQGKDKAYFELQVHQPGNILPVAAVERAWPFSPWRKSCCTNGHTLPLWKRLPGTRK